MSNITVHDALRAKFKDRALAPDTLFLLNSRDALEFLDAGTAEGLILLGIEGFYITDRGAYQPHQEFSKDLEWHGSRVEFEKETRELLRRGAALGIRFQIVFEIG